MSMRDFLKKMELEGGVLHENDKVSTGIEVSIMKALSDGPILYFEDVEGYETSVIANVCGTRGRIYSARAHAKSKIAAPNKL
ncbi:MAG: UbiD family decarboxylase [Candidatus Bathyarchaeota archaeon]|nr:UbiD family decarboxylase [Candidatus Bathyarchaeota archaeon]